MKHEFRRTTVKHHEVDPSKSLANGIITLMLICFFLWLFNI